MAKGKDRPDKRSTAARESSLRSTARSARSGKFISLGAVAMPNPQDVVVLTREDYGRLVAQAKSRRSSIKGGGSDEDRADNRRADSILAELAAGRDETISNAEMGELLDSPTPLRFWRRKRGMTQAQLAAAVGTAQSHISAIENGEVGVSFETMRRIADELAVSLDDLAG